MLSEGPVQTGLVAGDGGGFDSARGCCQVSGARQKQRTRCVAACVGSRVEQSRCRTDAHQVDCRSHACVVNALNECDRR